MKTRLLLPLLALLPLAACDQAEDESEAGVVEPSLDGKSDEFDGVEDGGTLRYGETVDGTFDQDFQFFEYTFTAREDAVLDIEITQAGSSRDLDTTLFLYRNDADGGAPSRIAIDDDEGWGALSRISDFRLFSEGEYTVVVGTKGATGRGNFRLSLECSGDACEPLDTPECHPVYQEALEECFAEISYEFDYETPGHDLIGECESWVEDAPEGICPEDDEPLCEDSRPFWTACNEKWSAEYVRPATGLDDESNNALINFSNTVWDSNACDAGEEAGCWWKAELFAYEGAPASQAALAAFAREESEVGPGAFMDQTLDADVDAVRDLARRFDAEDSFGVFLNETGLDLDEAEVTIGESYGEFQWNWGTCEGAVYTVRFPTARRVLLMQDIFCYG